MKYMGSKRRIAKYILPIILKGKNPNQYYVEPFVGGCNMIDKVYCDNRIANDVNHYLIDMWKALQNGWIPPETVTKDEYIDIKDNKDNYPNELVGYVGFNCSYSGKWFGGYASEITTKENTVRNYQLEAHRNIMKQIESIKLIQFTSRNYYDLIIPPNSIIYCDPPYEGTSKYNNNDFDHDKFWQWCRDKTIEGHKVYISEYNAPIDFKCVWEKELSSSLSANGKSGGNKKSIEKLFIYDLCDI